ncbi:hypothetical protein ACVSQB_37350 [Bradyrhizobium elkanii]
MTKTRDGGIRRVAASVRDGSPKGENPAQAGVSAPADSPVPQGDGNKLSQRLTRHFEHERAEVRRPWQIVADAMPYRILPGVRELEFGIDGIDIGDLVRRGRIELGVPTAIHRETGRRRV